MRFIITAGPGDTKVERIGDRTGRSFDEELFAAYMKFNEDMHNAGVLVASEGLDPGRRARASASRAVGAPCSTALSPRPRS